MPNHFHLLVYTDESSCTIMKQGGLEIEKLTNGIRKLLSGYARIFNKRYHQTGSLFRQKTKAKNLFGEELVLMKKYTLQDYCSQCFSYIHQNPVAAGLVKQPGDWQFSSYPDYAGIRNGNLCNKELAAKYCYYDRRDFISQPDKKTGADFLGSFQKDDAFPPVCPSRSDWGNMKSRPATGQTSCRMINDFSGNVPVTGRRQNHFLNPVLRNGYDWRYSASYRIQ